MSREMMSEFRSSLKSDKHKKLIKSYVQSSKEDLELSPVKILITPRLDR
jgi:hypothetical protein